MLTIQCAEQNGISASAITFEFGGIDGTEGVLLVDDVPEANAVVSGGSIEKHYRLPDVERVVGGEVLRLNKESGGYFPPSEQSIECDTTTHFYLSGNQSGHSKLFGEAY
jgi:glycine reductase